MYDNKIFIQNFRNLMEKNGLTQRDVATRLNISDQLVSTWTLGKHVPRMDKIEQLCELFHCEKSDLLDSKESVSRYPLSKEEYMLILAYRSTDEKTKEMIARLLAYAQMMGETDAKS